MSDIVNKKEIYVLWKLKRISMLLSFLKWILWPNIIKNPLREWWNNRGILITWNRITTGKKIKYIRWWWRRNERKY